MSIFLLAPFFQFFDKEFGLFFPGEALPPPPLPDVSILIFSPPRLTVHLFVQVHALLWEVISFHFHKVAPDVRPAAQMQLSGSVSNCHILHRRHSVPPDLSCQQCVYFLCCPACDIQRGMEPGQISSHTRGEEHQGPVAFKYGMGCLIGHDVIAVPASSRSSKLSLVPDAVRQPSSSYLRWKDSDGFLRSKISSCLCRGRFVILAVAMWASTLSEALLWGCAITGMGRL